MPDLNHDAAVAHLKTADAKLAVLIDRVGECRFQVRANLSIYESLLRSIMYQQLAGAAAAAILKRLQALFHDGDRYPTPEQILSASDELLRSAGVSRNKMLAIRDLAGKTVEGVVPTRAQARRIENDVLVERLTTIRGVGVWTVEMLLIFGLGRMDVLPVTDYGVRKGFQRTFRTRALPTAKQMLRRGERWRPYRSIASWYLWRAAEE